MIPKTFSAVVVGGALGALTRWFAALGFEGTAGVRDGLIGPYDADSLSVLIVNVAGSALLGWLVAGLPTGSWLLKGASVGFCGSLTTFSAFALIVAVLADGGLVWAGALYVVVTLGMSLIAVATGSRLRQWATVRRGSIAGQSQNGPQASGYPGWVIIALASFSTILVVSLTGGLDEATSAWGIVAFVALAALGTVSRWAVFEFLNRRSWFPIGTFLVNVLGSFAAGSLAEYRSPLVLLIVSAALGSLTTFSTLMMEAVELWRCKPLRSVCYVTVTLAVGISAAYAGLSGG